MVADRAGTSGACQALVMMMSGLGPGIPPDKIDQVFKPFCTTKEEGMEMGLSICRAIIETHKGRIRAYNNPGSPADLGISSGKPENIS